jgi:hypothetical protein
MGSMMKNKEENKVKNAMVYTANLLIKIVMVIVLAPFLIPAYGIARLLGSDPFDLDGGGIGFLVTAMIAGALAIGAAAFTIGYLL